MAPLCLSGLLSVLLAADVRVAEVVSLAWPGALTVVALMLLVRPAAVAVSTAGSDLTVNDRLFLSWIAPRGIVASAIASLFSRRLSAEGIPGGFSTLYPELSNIEVLGSARRPFSKWSIASGSASRLTA